MAKKTTAATTARTAKAKPMDQAVKPRVHTLTIRLDEDQYRELRNYVFSVERRTGRKVSHQSVFVDGLNEILSKRGGD